MCNINYTSLVFDAGLGTITLIGTSDGSDVTASLISPHFTQPKTEVVVNGIWTITYSGAEILVPLFQVSARCGIDVKINSFCSDDPTRKGPGSFLLTCESTDLCPEIELVINDISKCDGNTRVVTFDINFTNAPNPTILQLGYGDGNFEQVDFVSGNGTLTHIHSYVVDRDYDPFVTVVSPNGCIGHSVDLHVEKCDFDCLSNDDIQFEVLNSSGEFVNYENCLPAGDYRIVVNSPSGNDLRFFWNGGRVSNPSRNNERLVTLIVGGREVVSFTIVKDNCEDPINDAVTLEECNRVEITCPSVRFSAIDISDECDREGRRNVSFNALVQLGVNSSVEATLTINNSNGEVFSTTTSSPNGTIVLAANRNLTPGTYTTGITIDTPEGCPFAEDSFEVEDCDVDRVVIPPTRSTCDPCCIWNWVNIVLFVITSIFILVTFCLLEATAITAILNLPAGGTISAVVAALSTLNIVMLWICLGLIVGSLISFILWLIFCVFLNPNPCCILRTLMIALSAITASSLVLFFLFFILQRFGCVAGALIDLGWFGFLLAITTLIHTALGCFDRRVVC